MRFIRLLCISFSLTTIASAPACSCDSHPGAGDGLRPGGDGFVQVGTLSIDPNDVTLDLIMGMAPPQQKFTVTYHGSSSDKDVTNDPNLSLMLADTTLGVMNVTPPTFIAGTDHGGTTTLVASWTSPDTGLATGQATIHVRVHGAYKGPDCTNNPACSSFPPDNAPACAASAAATIVYPNDGALLPPNLNTMDVQFMPGSNDKVFEIDFENPATDVRITTSCANKVKDTRGVDTGGCELDFAQVMGSWDFIVKSNAGGDPVKITVRATTDGNCAIASTNTTSFSVAEQPINGGIYYWQSTIAAAGGTGIGGVIERFAFGALPIKATTISPDNATCQGCHFLSRDGVRMTLSDDDNDSDDEYADVRMGDVDVGATKYLRQGEPAGFQSFYPDHSLYLATDGRGGAPQPNMFYLFDGASGNPSTPATAAIGTDMMMRPTMPDWSPDGKSVLFVNTFAPGNPPAGAGPWLTGAGGGFGGAHNDDAHVFGGSIWSVPYLGMGKFGTPTVIVQSNGDNNYYPSYSPDGKFIVYNHVPLQGAASSIAACTPPPNGSNTGGSCPNDSFSNPKARIMVLPVGATTSIDLENANGSPASKPTDVSNSWPKWSPFLQTYKGNTLLWITFSSTRDYGLHVRNHTMVGGQAQVQCYPVDSAEAPCPTNQNCHSATFDPNCQSPNIWMAAINLTKVGEMMNTGGDPSYPAFWLPYQAIVDNMGNPTHNHAAQWVQTVVTMPPPTDGGACIPAGGNCTMNPTGCCADAPTCTGNGTCGIL